MTKEIIELRSEHSGRDLIPVVVVGVVFGVAFALSIRELIQSFHQAELADFIDQSVQLGYRIAKKDQPSEKEDDEKDKT